MEPIIDALKTYGFGGLMAGANLAILWYVLTKTIPDLTKSFERQIREERDKSHMTITEIGKTFERQIKEERTQCREMRIQMREDFGSILTKVREENAAIMQQMSSKYEQLVTHMTPQK
jgi:F0F1-type ATP synthase membrane subunit b/b'